MRLFHCLFKGDENNEPQSEILANPPLKALVQFICGHPHLPKNGGVIKVRFVRSTLPDAESCFNTLELPLSHQDYSDFKRAMNVAINCQSQGYGRG